MTTKLFKSMNIIRCVSGAPLNLFRYATMVAMLLLGVGNAWAGGGGNSTYYSKITVSKTGEGTVYVKAGSSFSGNATSDTQNSSASSAPSHTPTPCSVCPRSRMLP